MKNKKGFTLIELLGVIVILSLIMLIAVPNVISTLEKGKQTAYITDAKKFITQAEYAIRTKIEKPSANEFLKITLTDLDTNDIKADSDGNEYSKDDSYVIVARVNGFMKYYVNLVVNNNGKFKGISLVESEKLNSEDKNKLISKDVSLKTPDQIKSYICSLEGITSTCGSIQFKTVN